MSKLKKLKEKLRKNADSERAKNQMNFFKTEKGSYGYGDVFLGIKVPEQRKIAKEFYDLSFEDLQKLLDSQIHEERLVALIILCARYEKEKINRKKIFDFYIKNSKRINNWDLVDVSAPRISGRYLLDKPRKRLHEFSKSDNLWEKRISIVSTYAFIRESQFDDTLKIAENLLRDPHDLIHKAVGWMLREVGKKNQKILENFLKKHSKVMPRTMLRYSIEKFPGKLRQFYMKR